MLRLSLHAKGRSSIILTHRSLPLIMALADYSKDPQHQVQLSHLMHSYCNTHTPCIPMLTPSRRVPFSP